VTPVGWQQEGACIAASATPCHYTAVVVETSSCHGLLHRAYGRASTLPLKLSALRLAAAVVEGLPPTDRSAAAVQAEAWKLAEKAAKVGGRGLAEKAAKEGGGGQERR
jgi:hypothetical protein